MSMTATTIAEVAPTIVAGGITDWINEQVGEFTNSFNLLLGLIAMIVFALIAGSNRTVLGVLSGFGIAVLIYWGGTNIDFGKEKVEDQVMGDPTSDVLVLESSIVQSTAVDVG